MHARSILSTMMQSGASAAILPSYGFNLFDLRLPLAGQVRPVLVAAADFADHPGHPGGNGTPILFPFPNRIRDGRFSFQGRKFQLPATNGPNAIHGFAMEAAWDVVEHKAAADRGLPRGPLPDLEALAGCALALANRRRAPGPLQPRGRPACR